MLGPLVCWNSNWTPLEFVHGIPVDTLETQQNSHGHVDGISSGIKTALDARTMLSLVAG
jgi:hypothetical protein